MKHIFYSCITAFSLYSAVPMPKVRWNKETMQHALCFFPFVGMVCGILTVIWGWLCLKYAASGVLFAAVVTLLPLLVTGGIHMDGFIDTVDAIASHAAPLRKLEIMKDPHIGAFGVIGCAGYLLLQFALWYQVYQTAAFSMLPLLGFVLSRSLNALSLATFPCAKTSGLAYTFSSAAARRDVEVVCWCIVAMTALGAAYFTGLWGSFMIIVILCVFFLHRRWCIREFGGNTGDLAGFLLQNIELLCLAFAAIGGVVL